MSWNLGAKQTYAINEAGCVHSVQGLEFDYVGVIIGKDMFLENEKVQTYFHNRASTDPSFKGIKKWKKKIKYLPIQLPKNLLKMHIEFYSLKESRDVIYFAKMKI